MTHKNQYNKLKYRKKKNIGNPLKIWYNVVFLQYQNNNKNKGKMKHYDLTKYDLSGKKVRYEGKVLDKFSLSWHLSNLIPEHSTFYGVVAFEVMKYEELKQDLRRFIEKQD